MKILLEAPILTQSGYGEHSRLVFRTLQKLTKHEIFINPLAWGQTSWLAHSKDPEIVKIQDRISAFAKLVTGAKQRNLNLIKSFDMQIHVGILNEFEKKAPYSICVTAGIETDRVSLEWLVKTHEGVDKIIVPSEHSQSGFQTSAYQITEKNKPPVEVKCGCPVEVVPYPAKNTTAEHLDLDLRTEFNFLTIALLGPRKNLENTIKCFVEEFREESVGLILKTAIAKNSIIDRRATEKRLESVLKNLNISRPGRKCKIYLLHGDLTEGEIHALYNRKDIHAYVTATHGEGYGLPIFEAAYSGLPIIATDWSGHLDFLRVKTLTKSAEKDVKLFNKVNYDLGEIPQETVWNGVLVEGSKWAIPREESLRAQMRDMYKNHKAHLARAQILKEGILKSHSEKKIMKLMNDALFSNRDGRPGSSPRKQKGELDKIEMQGTL